ncbi:MAG TPA: hypothetical protein PLM61_03720 [Thermoanaerobaculales bacterium]|nr:hypothetical protein [Thermoanaerobaculales bacterium]HQP42050.1 hypothetical protein [Thermoanaerobaculales bacterium]
MAAVVLLLVVRFHDLEMDPPRGLSFSTDLFTDEGWKHNAAAAFARGEGWFHDGDYNPIVHRPGWQWISGAWFVAWGTSLGSARMLAQLCFAGIVFGGLWFFRRRGAVDTGLGLSLLLLLHFRLWGFSRLAFLEVPCFALGFGGLLLWWVSTERESWWLRTSAYGLLAVALTVKPTAWAFVPAFVLLFWSERRNRHWPLWREAVAAAPIVAALLILYGLRVSHPEDSLQLHRLNVEQRVVASVGEWIDQPERIWTSWRVHSAPGERWLALLSLTAFAWKAARRDRYWVGLTLCGCAYYLGLTYTSYHPARYFAALSLFALLSLAELLALALASRARVVVAVAALGWLLLVAAEDGSEIHAACSSPRYTMRDACRSVRELVGADGVLIGHTADTFGLCADVSSRNSAYGTWSLERRLREWQPTHYVSLGRDCEEMATLERQFRVDEVAAYHIYGGEPDAHGNPSGGRRMDLYALSPRDAGTGRSPPRS